MSIVHERGDLFKIIEKESLIGWSIAHCISEDCVMGKGIAVEFKKRYGRVDELKKQVANGKKKGKCAYLKVDGRLIFYMITKEKYYQKPTYETMEGAIKDMISIMVENGVKGCVMPRIGCGLDRLEWNKIEAIINDNFTRSNISALVCSL